MWEINQKYIKEKQQAAKITKDFQSSISHSAGQKTQI